MSILFGAVRSDVNGGADASLLPDGSKGHARHHRLATI
jgi:hypothetical protein